MAGTDCDQGKFHCATENLFAGYSKDFEMCVEQLRSRDLAC